MTADAVELAYPPITGLLPYGPPSDLIQLFRGDIRLKSSQGSSDVRPGEIVLMIRSGSHLLWSIDDDGNSHLPRSWTYRGSRESTALALTFLGTPMELEVHHNGHGRGFIGGATVGGDDVDIDEVIVQWGNLEPLRGATMLRAEQPDGGWVEWPGRWSRDFAGWSVSLDERHDVRAALASAKENRLNVLTHTMRVRRSDGATFRRDDVTQFLDGLQIALSFALGRWVAPVLPVGRMDGRAVWALFAAPHVDTPAKAHSRWWVEYRPEDLDEYLELFLARWMNPTRRHSLQFLTASVIAAGESGFVEQRIMTAVAALEHLSDLAETNRSSDRNRQADKRLRRLLTSAHVPCQISRLHQPLLAAYAGQDDGPKVLLRIRHAITHGGSPASLYETRGMLGEASRLASRYLELALLHHLGYMGHVTDRTITTRWSGDSELVPWARSEAL
ncbi:hypothetical protein CTKZ_08320 [Cellulomonas algicola]|uniref:YopA central domain-containing protein n=1 Tax=Cellulomonas algicola TaxID=2071633 RepID=A0A401UXL4_9CELL|nr:hypothetical protein [Cellulomonas algicola]GCD19270.1 hypothetical protein CTKZ_08320 [Cellulomonas algicola]